MECDSSSTHSKFSQACVQVKMQSRAEQQQIESKPRKSRRTREAWRGRETSRLRLGVVPRERMHAGEAGLLLSLVPASSCCYCCVWVRKVGTSGKGRGTDRIGEGGADLDGVGVGLERRHPWPSLCYSSVSETTATVACSIWEGEETR